MGKCNEVNRMMMLNLNVCHRKLGKAAMEGKRKNWGDWLEDNIISFKLRFVGTRYVLMVVNVIAEFKSI